MPKLIDREASLKLCSDTHNPYHRIVREFLLTAPTVDDEPVRHGRWIEVTKHRDENGTIQTDYECSECFAMVKDICAEEIESERFCYNCGADMREGGADNG